MHNILELPLSKWFRINVLPLYAMQNKFSPINLQLIALYYVPRECKKGLFICSPLLCFCSLIKPSIRRIQREAYAHSSNVWGTFSLNASQSLNAELSSISLPFQSKRMLPDLFKTSNLFRTCTCALVLLVNLML